MEELARWESFYVIVGSSAGALIGLQFVVIALIAEIPVLGGNSQAGQTFTTPNVVHFAAVLLLSAVASAPWRGIGPLAVLWGLVGLGGFIYSLVIAARMRSQNTYRPVFEDWLFHVVLAAAGYATMVLAACLARHHAHAALVVIGAASLILLFLGIHNAWDLVTYHVFVRRRDQLKSTPESQQPTSNQTTGEAHAETQTGKE